MSSEYNSALSPGSDPKILEANIRRLADAFEAFVKYAKPKLDALP